ncbi:MAG: flagellar hook-basal body complex protein FliE [Gammaproteobacteria bacterium]|nr:flagellar hook-basal body complex protein FliE [Gammaproteobacteria bacterium]
MSSMEINKVLTQMRALSGSLEGPAASLTPGPAGPSVQNFSQVMAQSISKVNEQQMASSELVAAFQTGTTSASVAEVMIAMQKASLSFTAMTQVRNKLIESYQEIMNMPI